MAAITPPPIIVQVHHAPPVLADGDEMDFTMWLGPLPVHWLARIEAVSPAGFTDRQLRGPFTEWIHRHTFRAMDEQTTDVIDEITLQPSPAPLVVADGSGHVAWLAHVVCLSGVENEKDARMNRVVVIGAGIGGLTTAAVLARAGVDVTVLEAQVYPGGCASTYFHQGYRFDAGATLAGGFYHGGPMDRVAQAAGVDAWPTRPADTAMIVHLPDGVQIARRGDNSRWDEYRTAFGGQALDFFRWQEHTADALWDLALRLPPWPLQSFADGRAALSVGLDWLLHSGSAGLSPALALDAFRPVAAHLHNATDRLRLFVDAQLLISAQATSDRANALYGAAALDLPRRGVVHLTGGMGALAEKLAEAIRRNGGRVRIPAGSYPHSYRTPPPGGCRDKTRGLLPGRFCLRQPAPWDAATLLKDDLPAALRRLPHPPRDGWGAFVVYAGLDGANIPPDYPLHHQIILRRPAG